MVFISCRLRDILVGIHSGGTPSTAVKEYWGGPYRWLSSGETGQRFISDTIETITDRGVKESSTKLAKRGSVVMACAGQGKTRGQTSYLLEDMYVNQSVIVLNPDTEKVHPLYLFYDLSRRYEELRGGSDASSTRGSITTASLKGLSFQYPVLEKQRKIVSILYAYDQLIDVNNKRIKVLEQMAENLYKEWFVRFRFPGHETAEFYESRLGKLPRTFQVVKNIDVYEYYIGGGWGNDDEDQEYSVPAYVIRGTDFPRVKRGDVSTCPLRYHKASNYSARKLKPHDIIIEVSGGTQEQPVGRALIVTRDVIDRLNGSVICASFCKLVRLNTGAISPLYYYYWMKFLYDTRMIDRFQLQSTGIINFQFEFFLNKGDVMLPPMELMQRFDSSVLPIMDQISTIAKQNENLIKQRDLLLPRLMSGKLEV